MTILDSHVHVWDPEQIPHPWLDDAPPLNRAFLPANIDTAGGRIGEWIFVETDAIAAFARAEADWVAGLDWPGLRGVVAHVEMARGDLEPQLDELQGARLLVGVRPSVQNDPSDIIASAEFAADLRVIGSRGLAFDACVRWHQLDALADAATRAPETRIVRDHLGKPPVLEGLESAQGSAWRRGIERLAELPNVFVKCSGVPAEAGDAFDEVAGVFDRLALDAFGADRAMFGSDWPVSGEAGFGVPVARAVDALRAVASEAEWSRLAGDTARAFYGVNTSDV
jgi:L-fuconolactonase